MNAAELGAFAWGDCLALFQHFLTLSLLAVGGAITTVPDMHRFLVLEQHWLSDGQFSASIALAQAAPGPNLLFVSVLAWIEISFTRIRISLALPRAVSSALNRAFTVSSALM